MANVLSLSCLLFALADPPPTAPAPIDVVAAIESALADAIEKAEHSVVAIARDRSDDDATTAVRGKGGGAPPEQLSPDQLSFDYGSGVVIGGKGEILTPFHVVRGAKTIRVRAMDRQGFYAEVIASDPRSDLAVIVPKDVPGIPRPRLIPIAMGDATKLRKGMFLVALGNPFNAAGRDGRPSASWGILANLARRIELAPDDPNARATLRNYPTLLQLDAKLNLGMSGGAVINLKGELVGLTTNSANVAGFDAQAGYAIPMDVMGRRAVEALKLGKEVEYGFLGVGLDTAHLTNRVQHAQPGTPAADGHVQVQDLIIGVGDAVVDDIDSLVLAINTIPPGTRVPLRIQRDDQIIERTVELAKYRVEGEVIATNRPASWRGLRIDYTSTLPHTTHPSDMLEAMAIGGVVITEVEPASPADRAGLKVGQLIRSLNNTSVRNPRDFAQAILKLVGPVRLQTNLGPVTIE